MKTQIETKPLGIRQRITQICPPIRKRRIGKRRLSEAFNGIAGVAAP